MSTRGIAGTGSGMLRCAKNQNRTRNRGTRFKSTAGLPVPVLNPTWTWYIEGNIVFGLMVLWPVALTIKCVVRVPTKLLVGPNPLIECQ